MSDLDPMSAFALDIAVGNFGNAVESALRNVTSEAKTQKEADKKYERELRKWLGLPAQFRSVAGPSKR